MLLGACAQTGMPPGGPKDTQPPRVVNATPNFGETNVKSQSFSLEFDEFVVPNQLSTELIINPPLPKGSTPVVRGKKLTIPFSDSLQLNTTYIINLRKAIKDLNEGNVLDSNLWVFSTGNYLDSGSIKGQIVNTFDNELLPNVWVMLYSDDGDSLAYKQQANYLTQSDEQGLFEFSYLRKNKTFNVVALEDENADYLFSLPTESIAFYDSRISVGNDSIRLYCFKERNSLIYVKEFRQLDKYRLKLTFSQAVQSFNLKGIGFELDSDYPKIEYPVDSIYVNIKYSAESPDSLLMALEIEGASSDTLNLISTFKDSTNTKVRINLSDFGIATSCLDLFSVKSIYSVDSAFAFLINESDTLRCTINTDSSEQRFCIHIPELVEGSFDLLIQDSIFYNAEGMFNDSMKFPIELLSKASAPDIYLDLATEGNYLVDLLDSKKNQLKRVVYRDSLVFSDVKPGKYILRVIEDKNKNGFWDSGSYANKKQPEPVYYYPNEIELKKGFDLSLDWVLSPK